MHHKNQNKHSTANHGSNNNQQPNHMHYQYGRNDLPNPQRPQKRSVLNRIRERFQEKPATAEEVRQLGLNARRETYKTQIAKAKKARPGRFDNIMGGGRQPSFRRGSSRAPPETGSWLLDSRDSGNSFLGTDKSPSLSFITGQQDGGRRSKDSGIGKGLSDLF